MSSQTKGEYGLTSNTPVVVSQLDRQTGRRFLVATTGIVNGSDVRICGR